MLRVVADDTGEPIVGVRLDATLIGEDGGDGGGIIEITDQDGTVLLGSMWGKGRYQIYLDPPDSSRFQPTKFTAAETMLMVKADGSFSPREFRLSVSKK